MEEKKRLELARKENQRKESDEKDQTIQDKKEQVNEICRVIHLKKKSISVAQVSIGEGNKELQTCLQKKSLPRDAIQRDQSN